MKILYTLFFGLLISFNLTAQVTANAASSNAFDDTDISGLEKITTFLGIHYASIKA